MCLEETEQEQSDDTSADRNIDYPVLDLMGTGQANTDVQMGSSLIDAAKAGHEKCVGKLIESGADVNYTDVNGNTSISESVAFNRVECLKLLLKAGADVNVRNITGETALLRAAFKEYKGCNLQMQNKYVKLLLEAGADVNVSNNDGYSPIIVAARRGHYRQVKLLIEAGADVNCIDANGNTPISESAAFDRVGCLMLLLNTGADVNTRNKTGETPLLRATFELCTRANLHEEECVKLLMDAGVDVNIADDSGYSPMIVSASRSQYKQVELLMQAGADVNGRTKERGDIYRYVRLQPGTTALLAAARFRHALNTFKVLLKSGAHVNVRTDPEYSSLETRAEVRLNALETTFSGGYQDGGIPPEEVVSLLHAAGETTDGKAFYEFSIGDTAFRREIEFPECLLKRQSTDTLKDVCREAIRKHLLDINQHVNLFIRIPQLGLPTRLAQYLLFEEDLKINEEKFELDS